jgi:hypothetical protein
LRKTFYLLLLLTSLSVSTFAASFDEETASPRTKHWWVGSIGALVGGAALDVASTLAVQGHYSGYTIHEGNPLMASGNGMFGAKGVSIKFGAVGALITTEIVSRHYGYLTKPFTFLNFAGAGMWSAAGVHNLELQH